MSDEPKPDSPVVGKIIDYEGVVNAILNSPDLEDETKDWVRLFVKHYTGAKNPVGGEIEQLTRPDGIRELRHNGTFIASMPPIEPDPIPQSVRDAALLAERCKEPLPKDMTGNEAETEIYRLTGIIAQVVEWKNKVLDSLFKRRQELYRVAASAPLSDTQYDAMKDAQAESEAEDGQ
jgi:hypothetical protein